MKLRTARRLPLLALLAAMLLAAGPGTMPAAADLIFPSLSFRTGPYASVGTPFADGYADYFTLLNRRDGGINGVRIQVPECETGYNADKGEQCHESLKRLQPLLLLPLSARIARRITPDAIAGGIPIHTMGYGFSAAADGAVFRWVFNHPASAWDAATIMVRRMLEESGGGLAGKRIALLYHNSPYGQEPILAMRELARKHRFALRLYPVDHPGQEQKATWAAITDAAPDFIALWSLGIMTRVALEEARTIGYPAGRIIGNWWTAGEADLEALGESADGFRALMFHRPGSSFPLYDDLRKYVLDAGEAAGNGTHTGSALYNFGLYTAILAAEAARAAMRQHDTTNLTPAMMRDGLERLVLDEARMARLGIPDFGPEIRMGCTNHGGPGTAAILQWQATAKSWQAVTGWVEADKELLAPLIRAAAAPFAAENAVRPAQCAD